MKRARRADVQKGWARMVGIFSNTKRARTDVANPGGTKHRLHAGKGHCSSGPWAAQPSHPRHYFKAIKTLAP